MNKVNDIKFLLQPYKSWIPEIYYPVPAYKEVPDWYKNMASSMETTDLLKTAETETIKKCMPVFDVMTAGYLIKTYTDIFFTKSESNPDNYEWNWSWDKDEKPVEMHPAFQLMNYKNNPSILGAPKFTNPWGIATPKGYSCLFIHPVHRREYGGRILEGIVDTDNYHGAVNFPFMLNPGFEGLIPAGTPIAQVIPFKRDSFKMIIEKDNVKTTNDSIAVRTKYINGYKSLFRVKKEYK